MNTVFSRPPPSSRSRNKVRIDRPIFRFVRQLPQAEHELHTHNNFTWTCWCNWEEECDCACSAHVLTNNVDQCTHTSQVTDKHLISSFSLSFWPPPLPSPFFSSSSSSSSDSPLILFVQSLVCNYRPLHKQPSPPTKRYSTLTRHNHHQYQEIQFFFSNGQFSFQVLPTFSYPRIRKREKIFGKNFCPPLAHRWSFWKKT